MTILHKLLCKDGRNLTNDYFFYKNICILHKKTRNISQILGKVFASQVTVYCCVSTEIQVTPVRSCSSRHDVASAQKEATV